MGVNSDRKGKEGERELVRVLSQYERLDDLYRGAQDGQTRFSDVEGTPWWVECKRQQRESWRVWLEQAVMDTAIAEDLRTPMVMGRKNGTEWCVFLRLEDFMTLLGYNKKDEGEEDEMVETSR